MSSSFAPAETIASSPGSDLVMLNGLGAGAGPSPRICGPAGGRGAPTGVGACARFVVVLVIRRIATTWVILMSTSTPCGASFNGARQHSGFLIQ